MPIRIELRLRFVGYGGWETAAARWIIAMQFNDRRKDYESGAMLNH
jgi:hypothetical protein